MGMTQTQCAVEHDLARHEKREIDLFDEQMTRDEIAEELCRQNMATLKDVRVAEVRCKAYTLLEDFSQTDLERDDFMRLSVLEAIGNALRNDFTGAARVMLTLAGRIAVYNADEKAALIDLRRAA
jgi:hypothetical protein